MTPFEIVLLLLVLFFGISGVIRDARNHRALKAWVVITAFDRNHARTLYIADHAKRDPHVEHARAPETVTAESKQLERIERTVLRLVERDEDRWPT